MKPQRGRGGATVELHALECGGAYGVPFVCVCDDEAKVRAHDWQADDDVLSCDWCGVRSYSKEAEKPCPNDV